MLLHTHAMRMQSILLGCDEQVDGLSQSKQQITKNSGQIQFIHTTTRIESTHPLSPT